MDDGWQRFLRISGGFEQAPDQVKRQVDQLWMQRLHPLKQAVRPAHQSLGHALVSAFVGPDCFSGAGLVVWDSSEIVFD